MARYDLTPTQFKALEVLTNPDNYQKSYEEKATMIGVHPNTLYNYRHDEKFQKALDEARKDILREAVIPIIRQAIKGALGKSHPDRKMLLEIAGIYNPKLIHEGSEEKPIKVEWKLTPRKNGTNGQE